MEEYEIIITNQSIIYAKGPVHELPTDLTHSQQNQIMSASQYPSDEQAAATLARLIGMNSSSTNFCLHLSDSGCKQQTGKYALHRRLYQRHNVKPALMGQGDRFQNRNIKTPEKMEKRSRLLEGRKIRTSQVKSREHSEEIGIRTARTKGSRESSRFAKTSRVGQVDEQSKGWQNRTLLLQLWYTQQRPMSQLIAKVEQNKVLGRSAGSRATQKGRQIRIKYNRAGKSFEFC